MKHLSRGIHISIRDDTQIHGHIVLGIVNSEKFLFCRKIFIHISQGNIPGFCSFFFSEKNLFTLGSKGLCLSLRSGGGVGSYIFTYSLGFLSCGMTHVCASLSIWLSLHHPRPGKFRERENDVVF